MSSVKAGVKGLDFGAGWARLRPKYAEGGSMAKRAAGLKRFRGPFVLHMMDLLRSIRRSRQPFALKVRFSSEDAAGKIFFEKGKLVHAEFQDKTGEEAFSEILARRDGNYETIRGLTADVVSIERDVEALISEFEARLVEKPQAEPSVAEEPAELPSGKDKETAKDAREESKLVGEEKVAEWSPPPPPDRGFQEEAWMKDWGEKTPGFRSALIVRQDSVKIIEVSAEGASEQIDTQAVDELCKSSARLIGSHDASALKKLRFETEERLYYVSALGRGYLLLVSLERTGFALPSIERRLGQLARALSDSLERA
jgi:hypothetical protein